MKSYLQSTNRIKVGLVQENVSLLTSESTRYSNHFDLDVVKFKNNILAATGSLSITSEEAIRQFVITLKSKNLWDSIYEMGVFVGGNLNSALTKLKYVDSPYMIPHNLVEADFVETGSTGGIKGNGSNKYIDSGSNGGFVYSSAHMSAYIKGTESGGTSRIYVGTTNAANTAFNFLGWVNGGTLDIGSILGTSGPTHFVPQSQTTPLQGFINVATNGSISQSLYVNGAQLGDSVNGGGALPINANLYLLASNDGLSVPFAYSTRYMRFYSFGTGLSALQAFELSTAVQTLQYSLARKI